jgi:hypothetical protein
VSASTLHWAGETVAKAVCAAAGDTVIEPEAHNDKYDFHVRIGETDLPNEVLLRRMCLFSMQFVSKLECCDCR